MKNMINNKRGIALLIVLLITALLIALIFEFAYATRISLNSAANFRNSQRAYFLARSAVYAFIKSEGVQDMDLKTLLPEGLLTDVPLISGLKVKWENELGKIRISRIRKTDSNNPSFNWMSTLFTNKNIDQDFLDKISEDQITFYLPGQLRQVIGDDFDKIEPFVTTVPFLSSSYSVNFQSASRDVLKAIGVTEDLIEDRDHMDLSEIQSRFLPQDPIKKYLDFSKSSDTKTYKVHAQATIDEYTSVVDAIIDNRKIIYWKSL